jgi:hypothetical protein
MLGFVATLVVVYNASGNMSVHGTNIWVTIKERKLLLVVISRHLCYSKWNVGEKLGGKDQTSGDNGEDPY